jgi:hypothetical protein
VRTERGIVAEELLSAYLCPCRKCHGGHRKTLRTIEAHRQEYGRDEHLMFSMLGGRSTWRISARRDMDK